MTQQTDVGILAGTILPMVDMLHILNQALAIKSRQFEMLQGFASLGSLFDQLLELNSLPFSLDMLQTKLLVHSHQPRGISSSWLMRRCRQSACLQLPVQFQNTEFARIDFTSSKARMSLVHLSGNLHPRICYRILIKQPCSRLWTVCEVLS